MGVKSGDYVVFTGLDCMPEIVDLLVNNILLQMVGSWDSSFQTYRNSRQLWAHPSLSNAIPCSL